MKKNMKRIIIALLLLLAIIGISFSVQATTIQETTKPNDGYDTIESGTIIIGKTKFTPDTVVTGLRAAIAGANDMRVYVNENGTDEGYDAPKMYYFLEGDWYQYDENGKLTYIDAISSMDLYYVNNELKEGISLPTKPEEPELYTVTFMDGSTVYSEATLEEGKTVVEPEKDPTKEGYTFIGWYFNGKEFDFTTKITENMILTAEWKEIETIPNYTVTFMNGSTIYSETTVEEGKVVAEPEKDPTKEGYTFVGWYFNEQAFDFTTKVTENLILVAEWKDTTAVVSNQSELEEALANTEISYIKISGSFEVDRSIVISRDIIIDGQNNTIRKSGSPSYVSGGDNYIFKVYSSEAAEVTVKNIALTNSMGAMIVGPQSTTTVDNIDLTGNVWGGIEVSGKATLVANNLTMSDETYEKPVIWVNTKPLDEPTITFEGATRIHYINEERDKDEYHYYTKFQTVTYKDGETEIETQNVVYGQKTTALEAPVKEHYTFKYWYETDKLVAFDFTNTAIQKDYTLFANYSPVNYTIVFETTGNTMNGDYGDTVEITVENPTKSPEGGYTYEFAGWADSDGKIYQKGEKITITGNITLTPKWTVKKEVTTIQDLQAVLTTQDDTLDEIVVASSIEVTGGTKEEPVTLDFSKTEKKVVIEDTITNNGYLEMDLGETEVVTEKTLINNGNLTLKGTTGEIITSEDVGNGIHAIKNTKSATLTIEGGTYDATTHASATVYNAGGDVIIEGGTFKRSNENGSSATNNGGNSYYLINNYGNMTIEGGTFEFEGEYSSLIHNGYQNYSTEYTTNKIGIANPTMIINGGRFVGGLNTIKNDDGGILTINGGEFVSYAQQALLNWNVATINGGTFDGKNGDTCIYNSWGDESIDKGQLNITGGEFIAPNNGYAIYQSGANASLTISNTTSEPVFKDYDGTVLAENRISNKAFTDNRVKE